LEGYTFCDNNQNGIQDFGDAALPNVKVVLYELATDVNDVQSWLPVDTLLTDANGRYLFDSLLTGSYQVLIVPPTNKSTTAVNAGTDDTKDSDVDPTTGKTGVYIIDTVLPYGDPNRNVKHVDGGYIVSDCPKQLCAPYTIKKVKKV
jgi:hypothetical protein